jgi:hypothetical protein
METDIRALQTLPSDEPEIGLWPCTRTEPPEDEP